MKLKNRDIVSKIVNKVENLNDSTGWIIVAVYIILISCISFFHEPWFDEAQSWLIARDASIKDIIFLIPHYEGHPPLWHLYLVPFVKSGLPYELGLNISAILINTIAVILIVFKAPFKKIIRYTIPFTYFFFFLYGVVSRCYSFTILGFVLMAITYKDRNNKPFRYVLSMMLVCASTAYGILFCAGTAIVWLIEIIKEGTLKDFVPRFIKDKRLLPLLSLLTYALLLIIIMMPREDTFAANLEDYKNTAVLRIIYMFVLAPLEATFFTSIPGNFSLMYCEIDAISIIIGTILFVLFGVFLYIIGTKSKKLSTLILPYSLFALFSGGLYFTEHHISVITYFLLFWFWICIDSDEKYDLPNRITSQIPETDLVKLKKIAWIFPAILIAMPLYWNIGACIMEVQINYCPAGEVAEFIKDNELEDKLIMTQWISDESRKHFEETNINDQVAPAILAYFDNNIFYTFNNGDDNLCYNTHIIPTVDDTIYAYNSWEEQGPPDFLIGDVDLYAVFGDTVTIKDYSIIKLVNGKRISKDDFGKVGSLLKIYARNDLIEEYGFETYEEQYWVDIIKGEIPLS